MRPGGNAGSNTILRLNEDYTNTVVWADATDGIVTPEAFAFFANGDMLVDGKKVSDDNAVLALARESLAKHKDLRAVIRADSKVQHGRIIHVLDLLKQANVTKIAFGVTPVAAEGAPAPKKPAPAPAAN